MGQRVGVEDGGLCEKAGDEDSAVVRADLRSVAERPGGITSIRRFDRTRNTYNLHETGLSLSPHNFLLFYLLCFDMLTVIMSVLCGPLVRSLSLGDVAIVINAS